MTKRLQPIRLDAYKPLREVVSETLRQAIQDGVLKPGERLMEIPLAEELGVSRTPIREAIRKLELEGFVVMVPRRGRPSSPRQCRYSEKILRINKSPARLTYLGKNKGFPANHKGSGKMKG